MRRLFSLFLVLLLVLPGAISIAQAQTPDPQGFQAIYNQAYQNLAGRMLEVPTGLASFEHKFDGKINSQAELDTALKELSNAAGVQLLDRGKTQAWVARRQSAYVGHGLSLEPFHLIGAKGLMVSSVMAESTAEEAGLKAEDWIIAVDGKSITGLTSDQAVALIKGPMDTTVELMVKRSDGQQLIKVVRDIDSKIGVEVNNAEPHIVFKVRWIREEGPAYKAGMREGHLITTVKGLNSRDISVETAISLLNVPFVGDTVPVTYLDENSVEKSVELAVDYIPSWDLAMSMQSQYGGDDLYYNNFTFGVKSFDFIGLTKQSGYFVEDFMEHNKGGIIDLAGAQGDNPEVAAIFLATFFDGETELLRLKERIDGQEVVTIYKLTDDREIVVDRGGVVTKLALEASPTHYEGKIVVVVDGETSGVAAAVARTLQHTGRATLVGSDTARDAELKSRVVLTPVSGIEFTSAQLLNDDGTVFAGAKVDRSPFVGESLRETAKKELAGRAWTSDFNNVVMTILIAFGSLMILLAILKLSRSEARREAKAAQKATAEADGEGSVVEVADDATDDDQSAAEAVDNDQAVESDQAADSDKDAAPEDTSGNGNKPEKKGSSSRWFGLFMLVLALIMVAAIVVVGRQTISPSDATHGKITVELFTDGSAISAKQKAIIDQLASEYSGDIEFKTHDVANNPYAGTDDTWRGKIDSARVIVSVGWYDDSGKRISWTSSSRFPIPKRELVPMIERKASGEYQDGLPKLKVERVRSTKP